MHDEVRYRMAAAHEWREGEIIAVKMPNERGTTAVVLDHELRPIDADTADLVQFLAKPEGVTLQLIGYAIRAGYSACVRYD